MKTKRNLIQICLLGAVLLALTGPAMAQTFSVLRSFDESDDGRYPAAGLTLGGNVLYGTTEGGSTNYNGWGTIFKINADGSGYTVLKNFEGVTLQGVYLDGGFPVARLILSGGVLYGTTAMSGNADYGTIFRISTDGAYALLHDFPSDETFTSTEGMRPVGDLTLSGDTLYGTTPNGGVLQWNTPETGNGTIFKVTTNGSGYTVLKSFATDGSGHTPDGAEPYAGLTLSGSVLYGTTAIGGSSNNGTIFKINTDGSGYSVLKNFTGADGANPVADLTLSGSKLYGTTEHGGCSNLGTVFMISTNGTGYTVLKDFRGMDGANPKAGLTQSGSVLYGTTSEGGSAGNGAVFLVNTDGTGYAVLKNFRTEFWTGDKPDGETPLGALALAGGMLYGTTHYGGSADHGVIFRLSVPVSGFNQISGQLLNGGQIRLSYLGSAEAYYALEHTISLSPANWVSQATNITDAAGVLVFTNTPNVATNNFWRIRLVE